MSTHAGLIKEIPGISVDRFDQKNLDSTAFFLSHCHQDHMIGLKNQYFQNILRFKGSYLYASPVSCVILKEMFPKMKSQIRQLSMEFTTSVKIDCTQGDWPENFVSVTLIPAGHCPGSVMFLFEYQETILYTGDYRLNPKDLPRIESLKTTPPEKIYLDTTFFLKDYRIFPEREDSLQELCRIIKEWISESPSNIIHLGTSAKYGYESLFMEVHKQLQMPVHVQQDSYKFYSFIPEMDNVVTLDGSTTQIHSACSEVNYTRICKQDQRVDQKLIRFIKVSAFRWKDYEFSKGISARYPEDSNNFYVCYSTHASYEEGVGLLKYLKPKEVIPTVLRDCPVQNASIKRLIKNALGVEDEETPAEAPLFDVGVDEGKSEDFVVVEEESTVGMWDSPPRAPSV